MLDCAVSCETDSTNRFCGRETERNATQFNKQTQQHGDGDSSSSEAHEWKSLGWRVGLPVDRLPAGRPPAASPRTPVPSITCGKPARSPLLPRKDKRTTTNRHRCPSSWTRRQSREVMPPPVERNTTTTDERLPPSPTNSRRSTPFIPCTTRRSLSFCLPVAPEPKTTKRQTTTTKAIRIYVRSRSRSRMIRTKAETGTIRSCHRVGAKPLLRRLLRGRPEKEADRRHRSRRHHRRETNQKRRARLPGRESSPGDPLRKPHYRAGRAVFLLSRRSSHRSFRRTLRGVSGDEEHREARAKRFPRPRGDSGPRTPSRSPSSTDCSRPFLLSCIPTCTKKKTSKT